MSKRNVVGRTSASLAIGLAMTAATVGVASASNSHNGYAEHHECASAQHSPFDYARFDQGGYVTAVTATSVTVLRWNGKTTTYTITPSTVFTEGSAVSTSAFLVVGDRVNIQLSRHASTTALKINIELAQLSGKVTAIAGASITISSGQGFSRTILTSPTTVFTESGIIVALANVTMGSTLSAKGTIDVNKTTLDALTITIGHSQSITGLVNAMSATSLTLVQSNAKVTVFLLSPGAIVTEGTKVLTSASLIVGDKVVVTTNSSATTTAFKVDLQLTSLTGKVTALSTTGFTIVASGSVSHSIVTGAATTFVQGGKSVLASNLAVGLTATIRGTQDANLTSFDASSVSLSAPGHLRTIQGVVTALTGTSATLLRADNSSVTYLITPTTVISQGATIGTALSLMISDHVSVQVNSLDPTTAIKINIVLAQLAGTVSAVNGTSITILGGQGFSRLILVSAATTFVHAGVSSTLTSVMVGSKITAQGNVDANLTTLDAVSVVIA